MQIRVQTSALLVVDIQNDFCEFGYAFHRSGRDLTPIRAMVQEKLLPFLERARHARMQIVYLAAHYPQGKFRADGFTELCVEGTPGADLYMIRPDPGSNTERVLFKAEYDAFSNPELDHLLQQSRVEQVLVAGVTTPSCIRATVLGAMTRGYRVILLSDAVAAAAHRRREHKEVLEFFRDQDRVDVVASHQIEFL